MPTWRKVICVATVIFAAAGRAGGIRHKRRNQKYELDQRGCDARSLTKSRAKAKRSRAARRLRRKRAAGTMMPVKPLSCAAKKWRTTTVIFPIRIYCGEN